MQLYYAGIGARKTPDDICQQVTNLATLLEEAGFILRSGGALGADTAFEDGVKDPHNAQIFLPWANFNRSASALYPPTHDAYKLAEKYHPAWHRCNDTARAFHARNSHQILGQHLDMPVGMVICWTINGEGQGGTGQALRIAEDHDIPIIDYGIPNTKFTYPLTDEYITGDNHA